MPRLPFVSFIVPCRNEAPFLDRSISALLAQDYPADRMEIIVADGASDDGSAELARALLAGRNGAVVDNPRRTTPAGLNIALDRARGEIVICVIGHSEVAPNYARTAVELLQTTGADCVGGAIVTQGETRKGRAIALALSSAFGVGGVIFRTRPGYAGFVDTAAFAAYRREVFDRLGGFDEAFHRNVDSEFNYRLTASGGRIWLDPSLRSTYHARATFGALWRQFFNTGASKVLLLAKHKRMPAWRHYIPGTFVASLITVAVAAVVLQQPAVVLIVLIPYGVALLPGSLVASRRQLGLWPLVAAAMVVAHLSYGWGFLVGLVRLVRRRREPVPGHEELRRTTSS